MKLKIELVPSSCWYSNVRENVDNQLWDKIRKKCYKESNYKCDICNGKGVKWPVECHEKWEYKNSVQKLIRFNSLCPKCHMVKHIGFTKMHGNYDMAFKHLMEINHISRNKAERYIKKCFELWEKRSAEEYVLDISYIDEYLEKK